MIIKFNLAVNKPIVAKDDEESEDESDDEDQVSKTPNSQV